MGHELRGLSLRTKLKKMEANLKYGWTYKLSISIFIILFKSSDN